MIINLINLTMTNQNLKQMSKEKNLKKNKINNRISYKKNIFRKIMI